MLVKTTFIAENLRLNKGDRRIEIACGGDLKILVTIEPADQKEEYLCTAIGDVTTPPYLPSRSENNELNSQFIESLRVNENTLYNCLKRALRTLMWRRGIRFDYTFGSYRNAYWSINSEQWNSFSVVARLKIVPGMPWSTKQVSSEVISEVSGFVERGEDEPLAHQVLREAWTEKSRSTRSALVLAVSAAEIGFSRCVVVLMPTNLRISSHGPLHKRIQAHLPLLNVRWKLQGKTLLPPASLVDEIRLGVRLRNQVVHSGRETVHETEIDQVDRTLRAVSNLLWILDFYQGCKWAIENVRPEVLRSWQTDGTKG